MLQQAEALPQEFVAVTKRRVVAFDILKAELRADLGKVQEQFEAVRHKFLTNLRSEDNKDGLLTQNEQKYLDCFRLDLNLKEFEKLMRRDAAHWHHNLDSAR